MQSWLPARRFSTEHRIRSAFIFATEASSEGRISTSFPQKRAAAVSTSFNGNWIHTFSIYGRQVGPNNSTTKLCTVAFPADGVIHAIPTPSVLILGFNFLSQSYLLAGCGKSFQTWTTFPISTRRRRRQRNVHVYQPGVWNTFRRARSARMGGVTRTTNENERTELPNPRLRPTAAAFPPKQLCISWVIALNCSGGGGNGIWRTKLKEEQRCYLWIELLEHFLFPWERVSECSK